MHTIPHDLARDPPRTADRMVDATAVKLRAGLTQLPLTLQWKQSDASYSPLAPAKGAIKYLGILDGPSFYSRVDKETSPFSLVGKRHVKDPEISLLFARVLLTKAKRTILRFRFPN